VTLSSQGTIRSIQLIIQFFILLSSTHLLNQNICALMKQKVFLQLAHFFACLFDDDDDEANNMAMVVIIHRTVSK
jgi:hypothetical protein